MVSILMVDGEQMQVGRIEFSTALGAYPTVELEGLLPISLHSRAFRPHPADQFIGFLLGHCLYGAGSAGFSRKGSCCHGVRLLLWNQM